MFISKFIVLAVLAWVQIAVLAAPAGDKKSTSSAACPKQPGKSISKRWFIDTSYPEALERRTTGKTLNFPFNDGVQAITLGASVGSGGGGTIYAIGGNTAASNCFRVIKTSSNGEALVTSYKNGHNYVSHVVETGVYYILYSTTT